MDRQEFQHPIASPVSDRLWNSRDIMGVSQGEAELAADSQDTLVDEIPESFTYERRRFVEGLAPYVRNAFENADSYGGRLADLLTVQSILPQPVLTSDEMTAIVSTLAQAQDPDLGEHNLKTLCGHLTEQQLADVLERLPEPIYPHLKKDFIRWLAGKVDNEIMDYIGKLHEAFCTTGFHCTLSDALSNSGVHIYQGSHDTGKAKIYLKKEMNDNVGMVRRMDVTHFVAWLKAYESLDIWAELGFDHIPVEPIQRIEMRAFSWDVDCRTELLRSQSFTGALENADKVVADDMLGQRQKILIGLNRIGVSHGHLHGGNFQVVTTSNVPRVYVIDFERAMIERDNRAIPS